jgi:hypothetical protein
MGEIDERPRTTAEAVTLFAWLATSFSLRRFHFTETGSGDRIAHQGSRDKSPRDKMTALPKKLESRNHLDPRHARRRGACRFTPNGWPPGLRTQPLIHALPPPATLPPCPSTAHCCSRHCLVHSAQHWRRGLAQSQACTLVPAARSSGNAMSSTAAATAVDSKVGAPGLLPACSMICLDASRGHALPTLSGSTTSPSRTRTVRTRPRTRARSPGRRCRTRPCSLSS